MKYNKVLRKAKHIYIIKKQYTIKDVTNSSLDSLPYEITNIVKNKTSNHNYLTSLPLAINNSTYYIFRRIFSYTYKTLPFELKEVIDSYLNKNIYSIFYIFKNINKKTITNMVNNKVIFIPVRYNEARTDMGAIVSQEALSEYILLSDTFKDIQKKTLIEAILESPLTEPQLIILPIVGDGDISELPVSP